MKSPKNQFTKAEIITKTNFLLLLSFAVFSFLFYTFPEIDLALSANFYSAESGFPRNDPWILVGTKLPNFLIPGTVILVMIWIYSRSRQQDQLSFEAYRDIIFFSVATLFSALLLVWGFKFGFSRIRPRFIQEFNGLGDFTPAFVINTSPTRDVSFVSGHAATGFMYMAAAFLYQGRTRLIIMLSSLFLGGFIGLTRLASGNHYLSDIVVAGFVVYFGTLLVYWWVVRMTTRRKSLKTEPEE